MRFLTAAAAALVLFLCSTGVSLRPATATVTPTASVVLAGASGGRAVGGPAAEPLFLGSWWNKFKKIMAAIFDFIDALIDATLPGDGKEGGGEGGGDGGVAQAIPAAPARLQRPILA